MSRRRLVSIGAPCWATVATTDLEHTSAFYQQLFGWSVADPADEDHVEFTFTKDGHRVAGYTRNQAPETSPNSWSIYLSSSDVEATLAVGASNGGKIQSPVVHVGALGSQGLLSDSVGAGVGVWQPNRFQGIELLGEPGTVSRFDLYATDYAAAVAFYQEVFFCHPCVISDTAEFRYTRLTHGDDWVAGILDAATSRDPDERASSQWVVSFAVADLKAAVADAVTLGGSIVAPVCDTPLGRSAHVADPTGAHFKLVDVHVTK